MSDITLTAGIRNNLLSLQQTSRDLTTTQEHLSTGKKVKKTQPKATVCDLCDDQCLGENEVPSCVYACPHDAAHRVDGQAFFDELVTGKGKD